MPIQSEKKCRIVEKVKKGYRKRKRQKRKEPERNRMEHNGGKSKSITKDSWHSGRIK